MHTLERWNTHRHMMAERQDRIFPRHAALDQIFSQAILATWRLLYKYICTICIKKVSHVAHLYISACICVYMWLVDACFFTLLIYFHFTVSNPSCWPFSLPAWFRAFLHLHLQRSRFCFTIAITLVQTNISKQSDNNNRSEKVKQQNELKQ